MNIETALNVQNTMQKNKAYEAQREVEKAKNSKNGDLERRKTQLEDVGKSFEKIFINQMLSSMRETLDTKNDLLYGGFSQKIFEDMLYEEYATIMSKTNFLGLSQTIVSQYEQYL